MSLSAVLALILSAAGVGVALITAIKAYREYSQQGDQRRAEMFFTLRERLKAEPLAEIAELVDLVVVGHDSEAKKAENRLAEIPMRQKRDYVGLFEEVAIFVDTGQVEPRVAHYMFGYYALQCEECLPFWSNINYDSIYWTVFHRFCEDMRKLRNQLIAECLSEKDDQLVQSFVEDSGLGPQVKIRIPTQLRTTTNGNSVIYVRGESIETALAEMRHHFPEIGERIFQDGDLRRFVNVYVGGEDIRFKAGLQTQLAEGDELTILPAVAGGQY